MAKENFLFEFRNLEMRVMRSLRDTIENSNYISKHINEKAIKVNVFDYTELSILNDRLIFIDVNGLHYSIFTDAKLDDLINILIEN